MIDSIASPAAGEPPTPPAAGPTSADPAAADDAALERLLAGSGGAEVAGALAREWRGEGFRENSSHAVRVLSSLDGTEFGAKLAASGLLRDPALWRQAARLGRALATEAGRDDGPARRGAARRVPTRR